MQTLSETARVKISQETIQSLDAPMPLERKRELRRQRIIEYIKRKPMGARIKLEEFVQAGHFKTDSNADVFVRKMIAEGIIERENLSPRTFCYRVVQQEEEVRVVKRATERLTASQIEEKAMQFSWEHPEEQNDLRAFVAWLKDNSTTKEK